MGYVCQISNLAFLQLEESGHGGDSLREKLRSAPIMRILEWAARSRAKLEGNTQAQVQLTDDGGKAPTKEQSARATPTTQQANGKAAQPSGKKRLLSPTSAALAAAPTSGAGTAKPQKRTIRVQVTKTMTGSHGMTIETTGIGNVITQVKDGSPAAKSGVKSGMRVLAINGKDMARGTQKDCLTEIKRAKVVELVLEMGIQATKKQ